MSDGIALGWEQQRYLAEQCWPSETREMPPEAGSMWYAVPTRWWRSWLAYIAPIPDGQQQPIEERVRPRELDTECLIDDAKHTLFVYGGKQKNRLSADDFAASGRLIKRGLREGDDFVFAHAQAWKLVSEWYKCPQTIPICRYAVTEGAGDNATTRIEAFPVTIKTTHYGNTAAPPLVLVTSVKSSVSHLKNAALSYFDAKQEFKPSQARIWVSVPRVAPGDAPSVEEQQSVQSSAATEEDDEEGDEKNSEDDNKEKNESDDHSAENSAAAPSAKTDEPATSPPAPTRREVLVQSEQDTLEQLCLAEGAELILETQDPVTHKWPMTDSPSFASIAPKKSWFQRFISWFTLSDGYDDESLDEADEELLQKYPSGVCGLMNLGNTCFMNSGLQCLSNTAPLREFFVSGEYRRWINRNNNMGTKGQLAEAFGNLVMMLWSRKYSSVSPRPLRRTLTKWAPRFTGYQQQDSQEFLSYLLDGIHEDLNEITKKPYVEAIDCGDGKIPEEKAAIDAWIGYERRNKSRIEELFHGQLRSTLICPDCKHKSITFDPFMYLSVSFPVEKEYIIESIVYPYAIDGKHAPTLYAVKVKKPCTVRDLKLALEPLCGIPSSRLLFSVNTNNKIYDFFGDNTGTHPADPQDLYVLYEIPFPITSTVPKPVKQGVALAKPMKPPTPKPDVGTLQDEGSEKKEENEVEKGEKDVEKKGEEGSVSEKKAEDENNKEETKPEESNDDASEQKSGDAEEQENKLEDAKKDEEPERGEPEEKEKVEEQENIESKKEEPENQTEVTGETTHEDKKEQKDLPEKKESTEDAESKKDEPQKAEHEETVEETKPRKTITCVFVHRSKSIVKSKSYPRILGIPFILLCSNNTTCSDLYREAWTRCLRIFVRKNPNEDNIDYIQTPTEQLLAETEGKAEGDNEGETESVRHRPLLHEEHVAAFDGSGEYPFRLAITKISYFSCARCSDKKCVGCALPCDSSLPPWDELLAKDRRVYIAVDWCHECMKENPNLEQSTTIVNRDKSVTELRPLASRNYTLQDCLEGFLREEQLDKDDEWYCSCCKEHKRALKKIDLWKLPQILIIHLKRFYFTSTVHSKITTALDLPPDGKLCMRPFTIGPDDGNEEMYRLYAVSNHEGSVGFGHYTAHCLNQTTGRWYLFNDQMTRPAKYSDLSGRSAYILFFERVSKPNPASLRRQQSQQQQQKH